MKNGYLFSTFLIALFLAGNGYSLGLSDIKEVPNLKGFIYGKISPDGKKAALTKGKFTGIYCVNLDGTGLETISTDKLDGNSLEWSDDSTQIASVVGDNDQLAVSICDLKIKDPLKRVKKSIPMLEASRPVWTKSKRFFVDFKTGLQSSIADNIKTKSLAVSPDESEKVFIGDDENVYLIRGNGKLKQLTFHDGQYYGAKYSPDGKILVNKLGYGIVVFTKEGMRYDLGPGTNPVWAPNGNFIVYEIVLDDGNDITGSDIYIISFDGKTKKKMTTTIHDYEMLPSLSADGKTVLFTDYYSGRFFKAAIQY